MARPPSPTQTAAVGRTRAAQAEQPEVEVADLEAEAVAQRDRSRGEAVVAARVVAGRIRSGAPVASPAPALATLAAAPASPVRLRTEERAAHPERAAVREAETPAGATGPQASGVRVARLALAAAAVPVAARAARAAR